MILPPGWLITTLGAVTTKIGSGATPKGGRESYEQVGTPFIRSMNVHFGGFRNIGLAYLDDQQADALSGATVYANDVLLNITGASIGRVCLAPEDLAGARVNQHVCIIRPCKGILPEYLEAYFSTPKFQSFVNQANYGATRQALTKVLIERLSLQVPPLPEQRRIVNKVTSLTKRIAHARAELSRTVISHGRLRTAMLRQAVTGALTQTWREQSTKIESVSTLLERIPSPVQGRGGREATDKVIPGRGGLSVNDPGSALPSGWQWVPLLRIAKQETGHTPSRSQPSYWDGGVPWVGIRDAGAYHGRRIDKTIQTISDEGLANSSARLLPAGTVCLSRTASVGYVTILGRSMATSQDFATWTCSGALLPEYLMLALLAEGDDIRKFGMGSTHTTIYFPEIRALHIALPPLEEQREIIARTEAAFARADRLKAEATRANMLLDRLESAILDKALRGELVPQDPTDEPASVLLERIRAERINASASKRRGRPSTSARP